MPRCSGTKGDGSPCERIVSSSQTYCYAHDPGRARERQRNASRAGKSSGSKELKGLKREVRAVIGGVLNGRIEKGAGSVALQGFNVLIRATEQERKLLETQELEERIASLEQLSQEDPGRRGGAM